MTFKKYHNKVKKNYNRIILQLEKSPTLGSIETTDVEKRYLAQQSAEFNLQKKTFCDLFPEVAEVCDSLKKCYYIF